VHGKVEYLSHGHWVDAGLNAPPPGITYDHASADGSGNVFVRLGGNGRGFNFRSASGTVIIARNMQWSGAAPDLAEILPIPGKSEWLGLDRSGRIHLISIPSGHVRE